MLWTLFTWLFYIILGAGTLAAAVFGAAWYVGKALNDVHGKNCSCNACQLRRQRQWNARMKRAEGSTVGIPVRVVNPKAPTAAWAKDRKPPPSKNTWVSVLELQAGMRVLGKDTGTIFLVERVITTDFGYMVVLTNHLTGKQSRVPVMARHAQHRNWLIHRKTGSE